MDKIDKILELLQKQKLTEEEQKLMQQLVNSDPEIDSFIKVYNNLNISLSLSKHINSDLLASFILYEKGDEFNNKIILLIRDKIIAHLEKCPVCKDEYNLMLNEYNNVNEHIKKTVSRADQKELVEEKVPNFSSIFFMQPGFKYAFATLIILIIGYVGLLTLSTSLNPYYEKNIFPGGEESSFTTRGRSSELFQQGLNEIEKGDYNTAIKFLSEDIQKNKNDKSIFYSYYIIGITYLKDAESDFIGLFKSFDKKDVELAIANLKESIDKNDSGDYENLKLDAYYYIGRAYLLIDDKESAISSFQKVIDGKGKFSGDSKLLIRQIEKN